VAPTKIVKRNGKLEDFDVEKLKKALLRAGASEEVASDIARYVAARVHEGMTTDEIRRLVVTKLAAEDPAAAEAFRFYDRVAKGRITFEDGKMVVVEKGRLYLGREVRDIGPKGLSSVEEVEGILEELEEDLRYGVPRRTINARLYALYMAVLKTGKMNASDKKRAVEAINNFRARLGWKPYTPRKLG